MFSIAVQPQIKRVHILLSKGNYYIGRLIFFQGYTIADIISLWHDVLEFPVL